MWKVLLGVILLNIVVLGGGYLIYRAFVGK